MHSAKFVWRRSWPWLILAFLAASVLIFRLRVSFDLSAFFPTETSLAQEVLLEQFRSGPGSRLVVIGIGGAGADELAEASDSLRDILAGRVEFRSVSNGGFSENLNSAPEPVYSYFLLMRDIDYSEVALQSALEARVQDLAFGAGSTLLDLMARDPYLVTLDILERLSPVDNRG
jgi:predicted exporter